MNFCAILLQNVAYLTRILNLSISDFNFGRVNSLYRVNHVPVCPGEIAKYMSFVAGLVVDSDPEVISEDDLVAIVAAFRGDSQPPGMYCSVLCSLMFTSLLVTVKQTGVRAFCITFPVLFI